MESAFLGVYREYISTTPTGRLVLTHELRTRSQRATGSRRTAVLQRKACTRNEEEALLTTPCGTIYSHADRRQEKDLRIRGKYQNLEGIERKGKGGKVGKGPELEEETRGGGRVCVHGRGARSGSSGRASGRHF